MAQTFDMDSYVKEKLTQITDQDERSFAKEVLLQALLPAFRTMEERYIELEERIKREVEVGRAGFSVLTTIIRQKDYDPVNRTWFAVCDKDLEKSSESQLFFKGPEADKKRFEQIPYLTAVDPLGQEHRLGIRRVSAYRQAVEELYQVFVYNRIPWSTVHTGYLDRFYELYPFEEEQDTEGWTVSYGEWTDSISTGYIPVWNIEKFHFRCMKFMVPCPDGKHYEHELNLEEYDQNSSYMVGCNEDILSIRYEDAKIIMTSFKETFANWLAYRFCSEADMDSYGYDHGILGNRKKTHFIDAFQVKYGQGIISRTELFRMVEELELAPYLKLTGCAVCEREREGSVAADMNWFIREEMFPMDTRRILELHFVCERQGNREDGHDPADMLRYAVSQVQLALNEYKCVGVLL